MKRFKFALLTMLLSMITTTTFAYDAEIDGIYYNFFGTEAEVTFLYSNGDNQSAYSGAVVIPETVTYNGTTYNVTSISSRAFHSCFDITSVTIPNTITKIGNFAFDLCTGLTSITIPSSVTSIGSFVLNGCSSLTSIVIDTGNTTYDSRNNCNAIIETASNMLIQGCNTSTIPIGVTSIKKYAFKDCSGLTYIIIPYSVTSIGQDAFIGCSGLNTIIVDSGNSTYDSRLSCNAIIETASNTLIKGSNYSIIPYGVTTIGKYAFANCIDLSFITIPNSVTTIEENAFEFCKSLTSITIPNSVTTIENRVFALCGSLTTVNIPNSVTNIGERAFENCSGLTSVIIGNSVKSIGFQAFYGCSGLTSVTIPNSVTSIGNSAFYGCSGLTSITIPNSVTTIGNYAFYNCKSLTSVTSLIQEPFECDYSTFSGAYSATLYIPQGTKNKYTSTACWKFFQNIEEIEQEVSGVDEVKNNVGQYDGMAYSISGKALGKKFKLEELKSGVYIINGKKILVK